MSDLGVYAPGATPQVDALVTEFAEWVESGLAYPGHFDLASETVSDALRVRDYLER